MRLKKIAYTILIILITVIALFFIFRDNLLHWAFDNVKEKVKAKYHVSLNAQSLSFNGLQEVSIKYITLIPDSADTLITLNNVRLNLSLTSLITGSIGFNSVQCDTFSLYAYNETLRNNISFLKRKTVVSDTLKKEASSEMSYREMLQSITAKIFSVMNTSIVLNECNFYYKDSLREERLRIPRFYYDRNNFNGELISLRKKNNDTLVFQGEVIKPNHIYNFNITDNSIDKNYLPFLNVDKQFRSRFGNINGTIEIEKSRSKIILKTDISANDVHVNHWRLAEEDVVMPAIEFNGRFIVEDNIITLDSSSVLKLNHASINIYVQHSIKPKQTFALKVKMPEIAADSFFTSLPGGMFRTLKGIKTKGTLSYQLTFEIDKEHPDDLIFDSSLKKKNFRIAQFGAENYSRIDTTFEFEALDGERLVRRITVGSENPVFTPIDQINPFLKYAVLTSEDGSFLYHRGFNEDAFRQSIVTNYKAKRFIRGGSTITMQLVKNCFLSRDKTVSRKAEEALIVWLIENNGLVSKDRMLEVYLNVIEWGPDVYGIGEASGFYFGKQPKELNLPESIYLSSIIPHPKYFKYSFDSTGTLKPFLANYYKLVSSKMISREWITPADTIGLQPSVKLIGPAKNFVLPADTFSIPIDSLLKEDIEQL